MKLWLFGTYAWQGNPKALFLYMNQHCKETHECWWVADNEEDAKEIKKNTGINNITFLTSEKSKKLFSSADVYVTENFRESYPAEMNENIKIFNTWHGVGLKHIELALGMNSVLADSIVRKYIKNYNLYKNNVLFLTTSETMENHFLEDTAISKELIIRGQYPRNEVYKAGGIHTYELDSLLPKSANKYDNLILFAPTYRIGAVEGVLGSLLPDFAQLEQICIRNNHLFIVKVHPFMKKDNYFIEMTEKYRCSNHILFWNDDYDIYEAFYAIDVAIIDYSSIFYDLLDAGVEKFIRYVPDLDSYQKDLELIGDYMDLTEGVIIKNYQILLQQLNSRNIPTISDERKAYLQKYFFSFVEKYNAIPKLIATVDNHSLNPVPLKQLHSFDIFDTLIRRSTLKPLSIFDYVRDRAKASNIQFPLQIIENWVTLRNRAEHDVRDMMRKTVFERKTDKIEVTLDDIYRRLQKNLQLTDVQTNFLKQAEIDAEITHVEPIKQRIDYLFSLKQEGHDVIMVSDMYLPEKVIRVMLDRADSRLKEIPLYLSSTIGHQKSTGKLYQHIFFEIGYQYSKWTHYGDNKHADGSVPRRYGIQTATHDIDDFIPFENALVNAMDNHNRYPAYRLATKMHRYRSELIKNMDNSFLETKYYNYAYVGSALVSYINWVVRDAIKRKYETLYFISRDGHFLKQIADKIIATQKYKLKTKYIYGSRKAWRLPSFINKVDDETFWQFGNFVGMDSFDDLVKASYLSEEELLELFPEFESLKTAKHLRGSVAENIRKILSDSQKYRQKVLDIACEKRKIVRRYLQQEINPNEKFAFVEFWGRGYTQDTFSRLLNDAFDKEITNPFYYVRSFTDDIGTSVRHNFILAPQNFSFFEPIFAQTPYDSIPGYIEINGRIEPIINHRDKTTSELISDGLLKFTEDFLSLDLVDEDYFTSSLAQFTYQYQMSRNDDQFICDVFSELKDNISSFGVEKAYAPTLTLEQLQGIASKQELDKLTQSIQISLAKSNQKTIDYYQRIQKNYNLPKFNGKVIKKAYAVNPLETYVISDKLPFTVESIQNNSFYLDVNFNDTNKRKDLYLKKGHTIEIVAIDWLKGGVPRLLTEYGYITAHKDWVCNIDGIHINSELTVEQKKAHKKTALAKGENSIDFSKSRHSSRKMRKLARDPYTFFKDAKNPAVSKLKHLFNEQHSFGRTMSRFIRKNLNRST
ncbi:CDP-glycerol glycerophosphotransferase family protein [Avibacterium sp. 20-126]|uniref:CDP-glycerol glycerophosphotransferase family protein n=1 Tax=Avibacterium sp. 20-126 TaxID=2911524 RepID=UPI0021852519|nr:CDP-glycerol glycerophosphotransferase family protein [Avibacterium sp. 20-126]